MCKQAFWTQKSIWVGQQYEVLPSEMEGTAFYSAAAEFGARALMEIGITLNITADEEGVGKVSDAPENTPRKTFNDLVMLALLTAVNAEKHQVK